MGKRFITLLLGVALFAGVPVVARAQEATPSPSGTPTTSPTPTPTPSPTPTAPPIPPLPVPSYTDIAGYYQGAIRTTAVDHDWLRLRGDGSAFHPMSSITRGYLAYAIVRTFGRTIVPADGVTFTDVSTTSPLYRYVNVAVSRRWMLTSGGAFNPGGLVDKRALTYTLTRAAGLEPVSTGINQIRTDDGYVFRHSGYFGYLTVADALRAFYNFPNSAGYEIFPGSSIHKGELAYALLAFANTGWRGWGLRTWGIPTLARLSVTKRKAVEFALQYTGYPYWYAGTRPSTGFDCSGFVWWVLRSGMGNDAIRGYTGWSLPERGSKAMAANANPRIYYDQLVPLDILTWDVESGSYIPEVQYLGHAGIYLGNGWFIHSTGSRAGVALDWMGSGYWHDQFAWARRIVPLSA
ncbi:MAG: NlpC/P60 family protein [Actinobacteria bacterium]|nr:NlpC/P60 family protein [Actinomycetota bacterium]